MDYLIAFLAGGGTCALVQILMDRTKLQPGHVMVLLVVSGTVLSFLGIYGPWKEFAGAGATVPLLGFGHTLFDGVKTEHKRIILIDDIFTTGATANECCRQIKKYNKDIKIFVLCVAKSRIKLKMNKK